MIQTLNTVEIFEKKSKTVEMKDMKIGSVNVYSATYTAGKSMNRNLVVIIQAAKSDKF